jgi:hypothetical protein
MAKRIPMAVSALVLAACGGGGGDADAPPGTTIDAAEVDAPPVTPDGPEIDAAPPIDATPPDAPPGNGRFVVRRIQAPATTSEANTLGFDLDSGEPGGDVGVDNQLGQVLSTLTAQGMPVQPELNRSIDRGGSITLASLDPSGSTLAWLVGANPTPPACTDAADTVCAHHLDGNGAFEVAPVASELMTYDADSGTGTALLQLSFLGGAPATLRLRGAQFAGTITQDTFTGKVGGMIDDAQIDAELLPAVASGFQERVDADCSGSGPSCGCPSGSAGAMAIALFDTDASCSVSLAEIQASSLVQALLANDTTIDGVDGMSLGVGIESVRATFTPPAP